MRNIREIVKQEQYSFLNTNEQLKNNLIFLTFGGSHAYGTNIAASDVDIRGCAFNRKEDLIGLHNFEQVICNDTDTVIYSLNKLIKLLMDSNPNCIEMLGCKPEHYIMVSPVGQELIDNRKMFISRKAVRSFAGYASNQLRRLQNAIARDALTQSEKEKHILGSVKNAMMCFNEKYESFDENAIKVYIGESKKEELDSEIFMDISLTKYPLRDYKNLWSEMNEIVRNYGKLNHRNNKKDELHLNKHAMHLVRLYLMAIDLFEKEEIITYRENDLDLLTSIRNGKYLNDTGTYQKEFFDMVDEYEKKLEYAINNSSLPEQPNKKRIEEFVMSVHEKVITGEYQTS